MKAKDLTNPLLTLQQADAACIILKSALPKHTVASAVLRLPGDIAREYSHDLYVVELTIKPPSWIIPEKFRFTSFEQCVRFALSVSDFRIKWTEVVERAMKVWKHSLEAFNEAIHAASQAMQRFAIVSTPVIDRRNAIPTDPNRRGGIHPSITAQVIR